MLEDQRAWNVPLVRTIFNMEDADKILRVPLIASVSNDCLLWGHSNDGRYSVKTGYKLCRQALRPSSSAMVPGNWNLIWNLEVPPKVKNFIWRVCRNCLPTRMRLKDKGVNCTSICNFCEGNFENSCHLFFTCYKSIQVWQKEGLWFAIDACIDHGENFAEIFFAVCDRLSTAQVINFVMVLYGAFGLAAMKKFGMRWMSCLSKSITGLELCGKTGNWLKT